jgi:hypothetical protein
MVASSSGQELEKASGIPGGTGGDKPATGKENGGVVEESCVVVVPFPLRLR